MKKKVLAGLLTFVMMLNLMSAAVFATEVNGGLGPEATIGEKEYATVGDAIGELKDGDTLTLQRDVTVTEAFWELNGKKNITVTAEDEVEINGNLSIGYHSSHIDSNVDRSDSTFTVKGLTVKGTLTVLSNDAKVVVENNNVAQITFKTYREGMEIDISNNVVDGELGNAANSYGMFIVPNETAYELVLDGNIFKNVNSHAFVIQGCGDGAAVTAAKSLTIKDNNFESWGLGGKADRAAIKIWADTKYAPVSAASVNDTTNAMRELVQCVENNNNTFSSANNTVHFDAYDAAGNIGDFPAPVYVAKIGDEGYETLKLAVNAAGSGDTVTLIKDIEDETIEIDKSIIIEGESVEANNVSISAVTGANSLTVDGITFTGNSWINCGSAKALTVKNVTANVTPSNTSATNSRSAFISLGKSEGHELALTVENCNIVTPNGTDAILGWAAITEAVINGNTFGTENAHINNGDAVKFMSIADGAIFNISNNTVYSDYNGIVFGQNTTRGNEYKVNIVGNNFVGSADHIWIEVSGSNTVHASINAASNNTVNGNTFTKADIKVHPNINTWTSYAGVDVVTTADGKVKGGTLAYYNPSVIANTYVVDGNGIVSRKNNITIGFVSSNSIWGEATSNAKKSFVVKIYSNDKLLGTTSLNNIDGIINGDMFVTWSASTTESTDEYWTVKWEEDALTYDKVPTKVELYVDGQKVSENVVQLNGPDNLNPIKWIDVNGVKAPVQVIDSDGEVYKFVSFEDALTAAEELSGEITILLTEDVTWTTGDGHDSTPLIDENSDVTKVIIDGGENNVTFTAIGAGVDPIRAANGAELVFNNIKIVDESVSYKEDSWEFGYLEMAGKLSFENCEFVNAISIDGTDAKFKNCTFNSNKDNEYAVWVSNGNGTFEDCKFTGPRGLKLHEAYGSEISTVIVKNTLFENITKKPGIAIGDLNADTTVTIENSKFINCQPGDQKLYIYETDTDVTTFTFNLKSNFSCEKHVIKAVAESSASCKGTGVKAHYKCNTCGTLYSDAAGTTIVTADSLVLSAKGHSYSKKYDSSSHWSQCSACGKVKDDATHSYSNGKCSCGHTVKVEVYVPETPAPAPTPAPETTTTTQTTTQTTTTIKPVEEAAKPVETPVEEVKVDTKIVEEVATEEVKAVVKETVTVAEVKEVEKETGTVTEIKVAVTTETVDKVIENTEAGATVILPLTEVAEEGQAVTEAEVAVEALEKIVEAEAALTVEFEGVKVTFEPETIKAIAEQAQGSVIELRVVPVEHHELNEEQQKVLEAHDVAVRVSAQIFSDGEYIGDFKGGKATIAIPFTPEEGKAAEDHKVYFVDDNGEMTLMPAVYVDGHMVFETTHFSDYVIVYDEVASAEEGPSPVDDDMAVEAPVEDVQEEAGLPIVPIIIVVVAVILVVAFIATRNKKDEE